MGIPGDGIFFSAVMSVGILFVGLLTGMVLTSTPGLTMPVFEPWAAVGGAIWMCGNLMCPYIIKLIGMGLGLTVWDLSKMIIGCFTGHFGLFGVQKEHHKRQAGKTTARLHLKMLPSRNYNKS